MKRWIESLLIAISASLVTLLVAWSSAQREGAANRAAPSAPALSSSAAVANAESLPAACDDDVMQQLAMLDVPDHNDLLRRSLGDHARGAAAEASSDSGSPPVSRWRQELYARCIEVAKDIDSNLAKHMSELRQRDPAEFDRSMRQSGRKLLAMAELKERDPDLYGAKLIELRMELSVRQKSRELREARAAGNRAESDSLEKQLRTALMNQLLLSIKARGDIICQLQERIDTMKAELQYDAVHFNESVEERFKAAIDPAASPKAPASALPALPVSSHN
jgi:hypothetical protein